MTGQDAAIQARLDDPMDIVLSGDPYAEALKAVLGEHPERRIAIDATSSYWICETCCCDSDGYRTADCRVSHTHLVGDWRCRTVGAIAKALHVGGAS